MTLDLRQNIPMTPVEHGEAIWAITIDLTKKCNLRCDYCNPAGTPILMADLTHRPIENLQVGDKVIGFEKSDRTRYTTSVVEGKAVRFSKLIEVVTDRGSFRCTPDHKWFNGEAYASAKVGMKIFFVTKPNIWNINNDYRIGYIHGVVSGTGVFSKEEHIYKVNPQRREGYEYHYFGLSSNDREPLDRVSQYIKDLKLPSSEVFEYAEKTYGARAEKKDIFSLFQGSPDKNSSLDYVKGWLAGIFDMKGKYADGITFPKLLEPMLTSVTDSLHRLGISCSKKEFLVEKGIDVKISKSCASEVKFFATINPCVAKKKEGVLIGKGLGLKATIIDIKPLKEEKVYSIQTSSGNYIAHGYTSKNCFTHLSKGKYEDSDLTEEMGRKMIDWAFDPGTIGNGNKMDITYWGGEPLLRWELLKSLTLYAKDVAKKANKIVTFNGTTNVTLLTPDKFEFMREHGMNFLLSIDGRPETHDLHRKYADGTGSYSDIDKNIDAILKEWGNNATARLSYSIDNIAEFDKDIKYLYDRGFRNIAYSPVVEGDWTEEKLQALRDTWDRIGEWYVELYKQGDPPYLKYINDFCSSTYTPEGNRPPCGAGRGYITLTTDGSIYPCHRFNKFDDNRPWYEKEVCIGHIDYGILNSDWRNRFIKWDTSKDLPASCQSCEELDKGCNGGCWAANLDICEDIGTSPKIWCVTVEANRKVALATLDALGEEFARKYQKQRRRINNIPIAQGCECYNVWDSLHGRIYENKNDEHSCFCNMATYGNEPKPLTKCGCYNAEDNFVTLYDNSGNSCSMFGMEEEHSCGGKECKCKTKDPVEEAIAYLKSVNFDLKSLTEEQKEKLNDFIELTEENKSSREELDMLNDVVSSLEKQSEI